MLTMSNALVRSMKAKEREKGKAKERESEGKSSTALSTSSGVVTGLVAMSTVDLSARKANA